ncbi:hypothetical protein R1sor_018603 [Riccia sorocarpa]|uniref:CCHC-type domain-containing protein n=1 Tax=Riccia sorocarpa TaxID=122646 RepID=A0ABD3IAM4_9MARC
MELPSKVGIRTPWNKIYLQKVVFTSIPDHCFICLKKGHWARNCHAKNLGDTRGAGRFRQGEEVQRTSVGLQNLVAEKEMHSGSAMVVPTQDPHGSEKKDVGGGNNVGESDIQMEVEEDGEKACGFSRVNGEKDSVKPLRRVGTGWLEHEENVDDLIGNVPTFRRSYPFLLVGHHFLIPPWGEWREEENMASALHHIPQGSVDVCFVLGYGSHGEVLLE